MSTIVTEKEKTTIVTENVHREQNKDQDARSLETKLSGEQEERRMQTAQEVLKQLQVTLQDKDTPQTEVINDVLAKTEQFLMNQSKKNTADPDTRRTLEDIAYFVGSIKNLSQNKKLAERLQFISDETARALSAGKSEFSGSSMEKEVKVFVDTWRPIFELLVTSREFRELCVDLLKIFRQVLIRHHQELGKDVEEKFLEGQNPKTIAKEAAIDVKESYQTNDGDIQVKISDEEWDQIYDDLAHVMVTLSQHSSYHDGIERLFKLFDLWYGQLEFAAESVTTPYARSARSAREEAENLVASFSGRVVFDNWKESLRRLVKHASNDEYTRIYIGEIREFILDTKNAELVEKEEFKIKSRGLATRGRLLVRDYKYGDELNDFFDRSQELFDNIRNDEFVSVLRHNAGLVAEDLSYIDNEGRPQLDLEMIGKLRKVILPVLAESFKYIPIPRIERSDSKREYWVDNIVLCGYDVLPDNINFQIESNTQISIRDIETKQSHTRLVITLKNIRTELKDLEFYFKNKRVIDVSERGRVTIRLTGDGATLTMIFSLDQYLEDKYPRVGEGEVHFDIHKLDIEFDKSSLKHDVIVPMATKMMKPKISSQIEKEVEKNILKMMKPIGEQLTNALRQVNRPVLKGVSKVRETIKGSEVGLVHEKRKEKLE